MNKDYRYFQGESVCPSEDFISPLKCAFWECEALYYANEKKLIEEYPTPYDYAKNYCSAILDKWYAGSDFTVDDFFNDYLHPEEDIIKD